MNLCLVCKFDSPEEIHVPEYLQYFNHYKAEKQTIEFMSAKFQKPFCLCLSYREFKEYTLMCLNIGKLINH